MRLTLILMCCGSLSAVANADDLSRRHRAAIQCAKHFVEQPSRDIGAHNVTVMYLDSWHRELERTLIVSFADGRSVRAEFFRAAGRSYYDQCRTYFEQHTAALENPADGVLDMDAPKQDRWLLTDENCALLQKDFAALPRILESNAAALRREMSGSDARSGNSSAQETVVVRADGPSYRVKLHVRGMDTIELRPAAGSDLERLVEQMLDHANKCAFNLRQSPGTP